MSKETRRKVRDAPLLGYRYAFQPICWRWRARLGCLSRSLFAKSCRHAQHTHAWSFRVCECVGGVEVTEVRRKTQGTNAPERGKSQSVGLPVYELPVYELPVYGLPVYGLPVYGFGLRAQGSGFTPGRCVCARGSRQDLLSRTSPSRR